MRFKRFGGVMLAAALVIFSSMVLAQAPPRTVDVSDPQDGGTLALFAGDTLLVRLHSTPGTGYSWQVAQIDNKFLLQQGAVTFEPPPNNIPGAEGHAELRFLAVTPAHRHCSSFTRDPGKRTRPRPGPLLFK